MCHDASMRRTVLIVDDDVRFRSFARAVLLADGFEVVGEAEDGAGAVDLARRLHPEIVVLDVQLPDFDGFEAASRILARDGAPAIVLVSSRDAADYGSRITSSGARGFVPKEELSGSAVNGLLAGSP